MRYLSLTGLLGMYGRIVKDHRNLVIPSHQMMSMPFNTSQSFDPFTIVRTEVDGQVVVALHPRDGLVDRMTLPDMSVFPVLEVEWLKEELELDEDTTETLNQLSYLTMVWYLWWDRSNLAASWIDYLNTQENVFVEVEDVKDTAAIISKYGLDEVSLPKIRSWTTVLLYGTTFHTIFKRCKEQTLVDKEMIFHAPIMLMLFMRDYCVDKLDKWTKQVRLIVENDIQTYMYDINRYAVNNDRREHTYGLASGITRGDIAFLRTIFNIMYTKIHELNSNIGLISYVDYKHVRGPETIKANVRLSGMDINWRDEIERADMEKGIESKSDEDEDDNNDNDDYYDDDDFYDDDDDY